MRRVTKATANTLTAVFMADETAQTATGPVSVVIKNPAGVTVVSTTATLNGTTYSVTLPPTTTLGVYTASWTGIFSGYTTTIESAVEVTGGALFSVADARASDSAMTDTTRYPAAEIREYRDMVEEEFERITGRSFTPRGKTVRFTADGSDYLYLNVYDVRALTSLTVGGTAADLTAYSVDEFGRLSGLAAVVEGTTGVATVEYGFANVPGDVRRAGLMRLRHFMNSENSAIPDRATNFVAAEGGQFTLATPGRSGYETGIPEIDATLGRYTNRVLRDLGLV